MPKLTDKNRLSITHPELCKEWNYAKNEDFKPEMVSFGSNKKVWWKCKQEHIWIDKVSERTTHKGNCPYCSRKRVSDINRLSKIFPEISKQWDYEKNKGMTPDSVSCASLKKVHWKCKDGHEYEMTIANKTSNNQGCPYCSCKRLSDKNRLSIVNQKLSKEWNYKRNINLTPFDVSCGTNKKIWWICEKGHEWMSSINSRNSEKLGCPFCSGHKVNKENCLKTKNGKLANEWNYDKNLSFSPEDYTCHSSKKAWWVCKKGHEWIASIGNRNGGNGCPYCSNQKVCSENCLFTKNPEIAKEWHPTKNGKLTPKDVINGSSKKAWWICKNGHEWESQISNRTNGWGCPYCNKILLKDGSAFDSIVEAYYYLKFLKPKYNDIKFNNMYGRILGKRRYDFYVPKTNTYFEITGFFYHKNPWQKKFWKKYILGIDKKRKYVENKLKAKFKFVQIKLSIDQTIFVRKNSV